MNPVDKLVPTLAMKTMPADKAENFLSSLKVLKTDWASTFITFISGGDSVWLGEQNQTSLASAFAFLSFTVN